MASATCFSSATRLVWAGNHGHHNNRNRSIALERLLPLLAVPGIDWIALQTGIADRVGQPSSTFVLPLATAAINQPGLIDTNLL